MQLGAAWEVEPRKEVFMANIFGNTDPPRWLQERALRPVPNFGSIAGTALAGGLLSLTAGKDEEGRDVKKSFLQGVGEARMNQQDPMWMLKAKALDYQIANNNARTTATWEGLGLRQQEASNWAQDIPKLSEWMSQPIEQQVTSGPPPMSSKQGVASATQLHRAVTGSAVARGMTAARSKYDARLAKLLDPTTGVPEIATGLALQSGQFPNETNWKSLEIAEQRTQLWKQEALKTAEATAAEQGLRPSGITTTSDGKVTTRYTPTGTDSDSLYAQPPEVITVAGHTLLKWGKQLRELQTDNMEQKARVNIASSKVRSAYAAWIADQANVALKNAYDNATEELNALFGPEPMPEPAPEPTPEPEPATNSIRVLSITPAP